VSKESSKIRNSLTLVWRTSWTCLELKLACTHIVNIKCPLYTIWAAFQPSFYANRQSGIQKPIGGLLSPTLRSPPAAPAPPWHHYTELTLSCPLWSKPLREASQAIRHNGDPEPWGLPAVRCSPFEASWGFQEYPTVSGESSLLNNPRNYIARRKTRSTQAREHILAIP
jgi:hypothetical protein